MLPDAWCCSDHDRPDVEFGVLLDDNGISADRDGGTGKDPNRFAGAHNTTIVGARGNLADYLEVCRHDLTISGAHGVPIHGSDCDGRVRPARGEIFS